MIEAMNNGLKFPGMALVLPLGILYQLMKSFYIAIRGEIVFIPKANISQFLRFE